MILALILGCLLGTAAGFASRYIFGKIIYKDAKAFNIIWLSLTFARFVLVMTAFITLYKTGWLPAFPFVAAMIITQTAIAATPLKTIRKKADAN